MSIELNRIIIPARSKWASATFLASILGVPAGPQRELSVPVKVGNGVTLGYVDAERFDPHHCAFCHQCWLQQHDESQHVSSIRIGWR